jgi:catechol 2,3-dioxygenase-like lactoylglutathione lyase family enzyme
MSTPSEPGRGISCTGRIKTTTGTPGTPHTWRLSRPVRTCPPDGFVVVDHEPGNTVSGFLNLRVADIQACYEQWSSRGAEFITQPIDRGAEIRCYMRDPDGYMIEVGQSTGLLVGRLAKKRPNDVPG